MNNHGQEKNAGHGKISRKSHFGTALYQDGTPLLARKGVPYKSVENPLIAIMQRREKLDLIGRRLDMNEPHMHAAL